MLPVATPPNAIVYEAGDMKTMDMVRHCLFYTDTKLRKKKTFLYQGSLICLDLQVYSLGPESKSSFDMAS